MKKKTSTALLLSLCAIALVAASVLTTIALLTSSSGVSNVFTVGNVAITMYESKVNADGEPVDANGKVIGTEGAGAPVKVDTNSYRLYPGETYHKDPTIYIGSSEQDDMYLFVKSTNMIRSAEAGNYSNRTSSTPLTMREQMLAHGWVEFVRSGDGVEIVWVYGERDPDSGVITPTPVNKGYTQTEGATPGEIRLCDTFTIYQYANVDLYGAASVSFTGFAIQASGFGEELDPQARTTAAWQAIKDSFPFNTGIANPMNPYMDPEEFVKPENTVGAYDAIEDVPDPWFKPIQGVGTTPEADVPATTEVVTEN